MPTYAHGERDDTSCVGNLANETTNCDDAVDARPITDPQGAQSEIRRILEIHADDLDGLEAATEEYVTTSKDAELAALAIVALSQEVSEKQKVAMGRGLGGAISVIALTDPASATIVQAIAASSNDELFLAAVSGGTSDKTASIEVDTRGGRRHVYVPPEPIIVSLYGFLVTDQTHPDYYETPLQKDGLLTYVILKPKAYQRNFSFLAAFFSVVSLISEASNDSYSEITDSVKFNLFAIPAKSQPRMNSFVTTGDPSRVTEDILHPETYDYAWANRTLIWFCVTFEQISRAPACTDNTLDGPILIITFQGGDTDRSRWIMLVDLSDRMNSEVYHQDIMDLISDQADRLGTTTAGSVEGGGYRGATPTAKLLDVYLSLSKGVGLAPEAMFDFVSVGLRK